MTPKSEETDTARVEDCDLAETMRLIEYDMTYRAGHGRDGFIGERGEVAKIITALRHRLAQASPADEVGAKVDEFEQRERQDWGDLHRLQQRGPCAVKPKLGGHIVRWAADEIAALRASAASAGVRDAGRSELLDALGRIQDKCCEYAMGDLSSDEAISEAGRIVTAALTARPDGGSVPRYLIRKGGAYYRPNAQGYTLNRDEAGRYTLAEAISHSHPNGPDGPRDGIDYVPAPTTATGGADREEGQEAVSDAVHAALWKADAEIARLREALDRGLRVAASTDYTLATRTNDPRYLATLAGLRLWCDDTRAALDTSVAKEAAK